MFIRQLYRANRNGEPDAGNSDDHSKRLDYFLCRRQCNADGFFSGRPALVDWRHHAIDHRIVFGILHGNENIRDLYVIAFGSNGRNRESYSFRSNDHSGRTNDILLRR
jgi:hypothetical protein